MKKFNFYTFSTVLIAVVILMINACTQNESVEQQHHAFNATPYEIPDVTYFPKNC